MELVAEDTTFSEDELQRLQKFHRFVFSQVLRLEKEPMQFAPETADYGLVLVPLNLGEGCLSKTVNQIGRYNWLCISIKNNSGKSITHVQICSYITTY